MDSTTQKGEMSFLDHLEELRGHLFRSLWAVLLCAVAAFIFRTELFEKVLLAPQMPGFFTNRLFCRVGQMLHSDSLCINAVPAGIQNISIAGQFSAAVIVSLVAGLIVAFPYIVFEAWRFIRPALYENERRNARGAVWVISALFLVGVLFGYYLIAPLSIHFFTHFTSSSQIQNMPTLQSYLSTVSSVTLGSGLLFELPALVIFLTKAGLLTPEFLVKYRRHAIVLLLVLAAAITPPDVFSQVIVVLPLMLLYECSIAWSRRIVRKAGTK